MGSSHETSKDTACAKCEASLCGTVFEISSNPRWRRRFFSSTKVQSGSGAHPAFYPGGVWAFSPMGTATAMIKDQWSYTTSPIRLHGAHREKFTHLLCFESLNSRLPHDKTHCTGIVLCTVKQLLHVACLEIISLIKLR